MKFKPIVSVCPYGGKLDAGGLHGGKKKRRKGGRPKKKKNGTAARLVENKTLVGTMSKEKELRVAQGNEFNGAVSE